MYRLAACAMARGLWPRLSQDALRRLVEDAERFAEGSIGAADLEKARRRALAAVKERSRADLVALGCGNTEAYLAAQDAVYEGTRTGLRKAGVAAILGDIFPYPGTRMEAAWLTPTIRGLARSAYDERQLPCGELEPQRLAVLADALEEVGAPGELVAHLRSPGLHVRGCHVVDLCLGVG
jgi:hypothetical protein